MDPRLRGDDVSLESVQIPLHSVKGWMRSRRGSYKKKHRVHGVFFESRNYYSTQMDAYVVALSEPTGILTWLFVTEIAPLVCVTFVTILPDPVDVVTVGNVWCAVKNPESLVRSLVLLGIVGLFDKSL